MGRDVEFVVIGEEEVVKEETPMIASEKGILRESRMTTEGDHRQSWIDPIYSSSLASTVRNPIIQVRSIS